MLDRHVGRRILLEHPDLLDVLGLGSRELLLAVRERDVRSGRAERDRGLQRRVAAADDEDLLAGELLRVVEAVEDLVEVFSPGQPSRRWLPLRPIATMTRRALVTVFSSP